MVTLSLVARAIGLANKAKGNKKICTAGSVQMENTIILIDSILNQQEIIYVNILL